MLIAVYTEGFLQLGVNDNVRLETITTPDQLEGRLLERNYTVYVISERVANPDGTFRVTVQSMGDITDDDTLTVLVDHDLVRDAALTRLIHMAIGEQDIDWLEQLLMVGDVSPEDQRRLVQKAFMTENLMLFTYVAEFFNQDVREWARSSTLPISDAIRQQLGGIPPSTPSSLSSVSLLSSGDERIDRNVLPRGNLDGLDEKDIQTLIEDDVMDLDSVIEELICSNRAAELAFILDFNNIDTVDDTEWILERAVQSNHPDIVNVLLNLGSITPEDALYEALEFNMPEIVEWLIPRLDVEQITVPILMAQSARAALIRPLLPIVHQLTHAQQLLFARTLEYQRRYETVLILLEDGLVQAEEMHDPHRWLYAQDFLERRRASVRKPKIN
jgi:hypothetical protein